MSSLANGNNAFVTLGNTEFLVMGSRPESDEVVVLNAGFAIETDANVYLHRRIREGCREVSIQLNAPRRATGEQH